MNLRYYRLVLLPLLFEYVAATLAPPKSAQISSRIWSSTPAAYYNDSYPIGNGRLGASIWGSVAAENINVNEDSLWSGPKLDRVNPDAAVSIPTIANYLRQGRIEEAGRLAGFGYAGTPVSARHYEPLGDVELAMNHSADATSYERYLDLADATAGVYYVNDGIAYQREYLASNPAGVVAIHISASQAGAVSFNVHLRKGQSLNRWEDYSNKVGSNTIVMGGQSGGVSGISFAAGVTVVAKGGRVYTIGDYVLCDNADDAWIYFSAWTSYRKPDPHQAVLSDLAGVSSTYANRDVKKEHIADYQTYSKRMSLDLGKSSSLQKSLNTTDRMARMASTGVFDPELAALFTQFGRYLLISTSRAGTLPPNLQGIWSDNLDPQWGSKYTININLQMNYWPSLVTNLADLNSPLHDLLSSLHQTGSQVARSMYNASGYVCHHNTDLWGDAAPQDNWRSSTFWPGGAAWLSTHVMEYYRFTGDKVFLRDKYPLLKDAALFFADTLSDYNGWKVVNPSTSPENEYIIPNTNTSAALTLGTTADNSLLWELFGSVVDANAALGDDNDRAFISKLKELRARLPPLRVSSTGGIMEWIHDYKEAEVGHRHMSHIFGLYPGSEISSSTPKTFNAAISSVKRRLANGSGSTAWSRAWILNLSARAFLPNLVQSNFVSLMVNYTNPGSLLCTGPPAPFQVDGNFGGTSGVVEAILQSHEMVDFSTAGATGTRLSASGTGKGPSVFLIRLLPALPREWYQQGGGSAKGLLARGGLEIDIKWNAKGKLDSATILSRAGSTVYVTLGNATIGTSSGGKIKVSEAGSGTFVLLRTKKDKKYTVTLG